MILWEPQIYYNTSIFTSLLIMTGLLFLTSTNMKKKIWGALLLSMGIGIISYTIVDLLVHIVEQNSSMFYMLLKI